MTNDLELLSKDELEELKRAFYSQAYEIITEIQDSVMKFEEAAEDNEIRQSIKRGIHTLKGDSNSFGLTSIGTLCHKMEDVLSCVEKKGQIDRETIDLLLNSIDTINKLLVESESGKNETDIKDTLYKIENYIQRENIPSKQEKKRSVFTEYERTHIKNALKKGLNLYEIEALFHPLCGEKNAGALMIVQKLTKSGEVIVSKPDFKDSDINNAEKITFIFATKLSMKSLASIVPIGGITSNVNINIYEENKVTTLEKAETSVEAVTENKISAYRNKILRIDVSKVDSLVNLVGELIIGRTMIDQITKDMENGSIDNEVINRLSAANIYLERTVSDIQKRAMKIRMVPVKYAFRLLNKIARDICTESGKSARLYIHGGDIELDKSIVDLLEEPMAHIIRNMVAHGIEDPSYRKSVGKPEEGTITINAYYEATQIVVSISDNGKGIEIEKLKKRAIEKNILKAKELENFSDSNAINLIFQPGLSTSDTVSGTSGRGIGMDIVKSAIEGLKGSIEVGSAPGKGTTFNLRFPLTLAVIKSLLFEIGDKTFALPISTVAEVASVTPVDLKTIDGKAIFILRDEIISVLQINEFFKIKGDSFKKKFILILDIGKKNTGFLVDRLITQQEIVIKTVEQNYTPSSLIAGASILGNGKIVLILNAAAIFKKAVEEERRKKADI
ncbi:MAG TPA: chemotaxis protein CheA [bacterium]